MFPKRTRLSRLTRLVERGTSTADELQDAQTEMRQFEAQLAGARAALALAEAGPRAEQIAQAAAAVAAQEAELNRIDDQLDLAARGFVANEVAVDPVRAGVRLSSIFRWYAQDFGGKAGLIRFLSETLPDEGHRQWLRRHGREVKWTYAAYDWSLNS